MKILGKLLGHELVSGSFYIFLGSMVSNFLAFILNLFLARSLSYSDYAIFASLLSVLTLAAIPSGSISTIIMKFATGFHVSEQNEKVKVFYTNSFKFVFGFAMLIFLLFAVLSIPISSFLHLNNIWYVILIGFCVFAFYLNTLNMAFLQSLLKFRFIALLTSIGGVVKIIVGVILVFLGFRAFGGIWAIFFMTFFSFLIGFYPLKKILFLKITDKKIVLKKNDIFSFAFPAFIAVLSLTAFTSMDVILVKHFFNSQLAGFYAGLSLIGKVIFYFTAPIPAVMFPLLVKRHTTGKSFVNLFYLALILVILPSLFITSFYFVFPDFVIKLFLGGRDYLYIAKYLGIFGLYLTVFSMVNVCVNFFLSINKTKISILVVIAAVFQIILIFIFHSSFYQVIGVSMIVLTILLLVLLTIFVKSFGTIGKIRENISFLNPPNV
jgi:O-antigen/teichoic acid export membrane protein